jgi:protein-S-isoprenylcysteine O-methyltransferase Ste14
MDEVKKKSLDLKAVLRLAIGLIFMIPVIFLCAGTLSYLQGWLYIIVMLGSLLMTYLSVRSNPELINERLNPGKGIKYWDRIYFALSAPLYLATIAVGSLDTGRLGLSPEFPPFLYVIASAVYIAGQLVFARARKANNYFSLVVRIQKDRGHKVCESGPYKHIRHPGYLGGLLFTLATPFIFGSLWAVIPTAIGIALILIRTVLEDKTLEKELEGYAEYKKKVRYRMIPYIW